jgi:uncharacterized damage-inducible protein DinB
MSTAHVSAALVIPSDALLQHWQGHRRLTRRLIEVFPEDQLFTFSVGGMRPFGAMAMELIGIAAPMVRGVATENWDRVPDSGQRLSKDDVLRLWDESTEIIDRLWAQIRPERFQETATAFGQYPGRVYDLLLYAIDNEIHHRGQGYVYLRALGVDPPPFPDRH